MIRIAPGEAHKLDRASLHGFACFDIFNTLITVYVKLVAELILGHPKFRQSI